MRSPLHQQCGLRDAASCSRGVVGLWWQGGAKAVAEKGERGWALPIGATLLAVRQLGLGGWQPTECLAVDNELQAWQSRGDLSTPQGALRSVPMCNCMND